MKTKSMLLILISYMLLLFALSGCGNKTGSETINDSAPSTVVTSTPAAVETNNPENNRPKKNTNESSKLNNNDSASKESNNPNNITQGPNQNIEKKEGIITVEEAEKIAEKFCRRPNIGAQAFHSEKLDIEFDGDKYYYFNMDYGMFMGDKPKAEDNAISRLFINSKDGSMYEVIEEGNKLSIGKKISKN